MEHRASDHELDAWEMVSSSEDGGSEGGEAAAAEAAALAASFLAAEPLSPIAAGQVADTGDASSGQAMLPGSPENAQLLQLMAAEAPAAPSLGAATEELEGEAALPPVPTGMNAGSGSSGDGGLPSVNSVAPPSASLPSHSTLASPVMPMAGGAAASAAMRRASSLRLRVVRSDEQEALERAVTELEKRASQRERELALAHQRLSHAQAKLADESHEAHRLRKVALIACSICAFLGLKALMGGPHRTSSCGGQAAACVAPSMTAPRAPCVAHSVHEPPAGLLQRKVAIEVEPLAAAAP